MISSTLKYPYYLLQFFLICTIFFGNLQEGQAQLIPGTQTQEEKPVEPVFPKDSLNRRTPRGTVNGFVKAVANQNYVQASQFLNVPRKLKKDADREFLVRKIQRLLDRGGYLLPYSRISDEISGKEGDELPPDVDRVGAVSADGETIDLFVEQTKGPDGGPIWLFSTETLSAIAKIEIDDVLLVERIIPHFLEEIMWGGVSAGQWILIILLVGFSYFLAWCIIGILLFVLRFVWRKATDEGNAGIIHAFLLPIRLYLAVLLFVGLTQEVGISILVRQRLSEATIIVGVFAILLLLWRLNEFLTNYSQKKMIQRGQPSGLSIVMFLRRLAKIVIFIIGFIVVLSAIGVDVTAGLAALGIGGLALALGAQKSIENFVGSVTLIADRPLRVGDFCKIGDTVGTVEAIGMRSTRLRTLDRTVVTIPNGELSSSKIENYAHRDRFRFYTIFNMRYETTADQMRFLLVELRKVLYSHPKVDPDPARVRFQEFASASLNIEIFAYILADDFHDFVEVREDLLLRMMGVVEESGTGFAFPSQTIYLAKDPGVSEEKTKNAEERIRRMKDGGELPLPRFNPENVENLKGSINYPPDGSYNFKSAEEQKSKY